MKFHRRVTLRCLCEDLSSDWDTVAQQRAFAVLRDIVSEERPDSAIALALADTPTTSMADHPLVRSFFSSFAEDGEHILRESISGLNDPHWWKEKIARWRGAVSDISTLGDGEVWLCAGGIRAAGESRDFYAKFTVAVTASGPKYFLPSTEDRRLQAVEEKIARRDAWLEQLRLSTLICLNECNETGQPQLLHVPGPAPSSIQDAIVHLEFELARVADRGSELVELLLAVSDQDYSRPNLAGIALESVRSVVESVADAWRVLPGADNDQVWSALVTAEMLTEARNAVTTGVLPEHLRRSTLSLGVQAHYTHDSGIVDATADGDAVRGLCGTWFVPTSDSHTLPLCPACGSAYTGLRD